MVRKLIRQDLQPQRPEHDLETPDGVLPAAATERDIQFRPFTLADMRPSAVTDRMKAGDVRITDATAHADGW